MGRGCNQGGCVAVGLMFSLWVDGVVVLLLSPGNSGGTLQLGGLLPEAEKWRLQVSDVPVEESILKQSSLGQILAEGLSQGPFQYKPDPLGSVCAECCP